MRFREGDKVRIIEDLCIYRFYKCECEKPCLGATIDMPFLAGKVVTIKYVDELGGVYKINESVWRWSIGMFDLSYSEAPLDKDDRELLMEVE